MTKIPPNTAPIAMRPNTLKIATVIGSLEFKVFSLLLMYENLEEREEFLIHLLYAIAIWQGKRIVMST